MCYYESNKFILIFVKYYLKIPPLSTNFFLCQICLRQFFFRKKILDTDIVSSNTVLKINISKKLRFILMLILAFFGLLLIIYFIIWNNYNQKINKKKLSFSGA